MGLPLGLGTLRQKTLRIIGRGECVAALTARRGFAAARGLRPVGSKLLTGFILAALVAPASIGSSGLSVGTVEAAPVCQFTIGLSVTRADGTGNYSAVKPGNTVCIQAGSRQALTLQNFHGQPGLPITFVNSGGSVNITNNGSAAGILVNSSSHVRVTGSGVEQHCGAPFAENDQRCGIRIDAGTARGVSAPNKTDNIEIDHVEVFNGPDAGITVKSPSAEGSWVQENVRVHHTWIHDMLAGDRGGAEAMYIGMSHYPTDHKSRGIEIAYNRTARIGWESYQVGSAIADCRIHDNVSRDDSRALESGQSSSIVSKHGSSCDIYNNLILDSNAKGILDSGLGGNRIYNNVIVRVGKGEASGSSAGAGIRLLEGDSANRTVHIVNNTIVSPNGPGVVTVPLSSTSRVQNNVVVNPTGGKYFDVSGATVANNLTKATAAEAGFAGASSDNYALGAGSPAMDAGVDLRSLGVTADYRGTARPQGSAFDIGAYEYGSTATARITP